MRQYYCKKFGHGDVGSNAPPKSANSMHDDLYNVFQYHTTKVGLV